MAINSSRRFSWNEGMEKYFERRCMQIVAAMMRQHGIRKLEVSDDELYSLPAIHWMRGPDGKTQIWLDADD